MVGKYYDSCDDLPMAIFIKITETGDVSLLGKTENVPYAKLAAAWNKIREEFFEKYADKSYTDRYYRLLAKYYNLLIDSALDKNDLRSNIELKKVERELEAMTKEDGDNDNDYYKIKVWVEQILGFYLDLNKITVREFFTYIETARQIVENRNNNNNNLITK